MAFRSVPRPSSPPGAKASTERPSLAHSHAKLRLAPELPILHRNHPTRLSTCQTIIPSRKPHRTSSIGPADAASSQPVARTTSRKRRTRHQAYPVSHASEHNPAAGTWIARATLLRSDLQPARPDAPNPDSHVKRTKPAPTGRPAHARPSPGSPRQGAAQCSHDLVFPPRRSVSPNGGGRYRTDDPLLAKQVLSH